MSHARRFASPCAEGSAFGANEGGGPNANDLDGPTRRKNKFDGPAKSYGVWGGGDGPRIATSSPPPGTPSDLAGRRRTRRGCLRPSKPVAFRPPPLRGRRS